MIVVLFDPRRPSLVPVEAIELLTGEVQYTEEMPVAVPWSLPAARPVHSGDHAPVLLSSDPDHPAVTARLAAGARLISAPDAVRGERLVDAVAMMDKLRTAGPWESEQTHDSLRKFLLEETYELLDAVRSGNADQLREELGDVLLQVLFHARIAEDAQQLPVESECKEQESGNERHQRLDHARIRLAGGIDGGSESVAGLKPQYLSGELKAFVQERDRQSCHNSESGFGERRRDQRSESR